MVDDNNESVSKLGVKTFIFVYVPSYIDIGYHYDIWFYYLPSINVYHPPV